MCFFHHYSERFARLLNNCTVKPITGSWEVGPKDQLRQPQIVTNNKLEIIKARHMAFGTTTNFFKDQFSKDQIVC